MLDFLFSVKPKEDISKTHVVSKSVEQKRRNFAKRPGNLGLSCHVKGCKKTLFVSFPHTVII